MLQECPQGSNAERARPRRVFCGTKCRHKSNLNLCRPARCRRLGPEPPGRCQGPNNNACERHSSHMIDFQSMRQREQ